MTLAWCEDIASVVPENSYAFGHNPIAGYDFGYSVHGVFCGHNNTDDELDELDEDDEDLDDDLEDDDDEADDEDEFDDEDLDDDADDEDLADEEDDEEY